MAMENTAMASLPTTKPSLPSPSTLPHTITTFSKPQLRRISLPTGAEGPWGPRIPPCFAIFFYTTIIFM